jgi:hypothetical protein
MTLANSSAGARIGSESIIRFVLDDKVQKVYLKRIGIAMNIVASDIKVADEVFVGIALLHREHPKREDFTIREIVDRVERENLFGALRPGVRVHVSLQCVANRAPNPGRYKMLYETGESRRRLLLAGDAVDPRRTGKIFPDPEALPEKYRDLIEWARRRYSKGNAAPVRWLDGVFRMAGTGRGLWKDEDPDAYVRRLREDWK